MMKFETITKEKKKEQLLRRIRSRLNRVWVRTQPSKPVRKGTAWGITIMVVLMAVMSGIYILPGLPSILNPLFGIFYFLVLATLLWLAFFLGIKILSLLPRFITLSGLISLAVLYFIFKEISASAPAVITTLFCGASAAFLGGGLAALFNRDFRYHRGFKKSFIVLSILIPLTFFAYSAIWLLSRGSDGHLIKYQPPGHVEMIRASNPSRRGSLEVKTLTYGNGKNKRRPEFGKSADLITEAVDASPFVKGNQGFRMKLRKWFWGFDFKEFPVNGTVWYPGGDGPFPLVLCVHGNHKMEEFSDPGYAYLGDHLASRGFIFVSVDENFFNGSFLSHLSRENDGRAWMLLQHFKVWREWNLDPDNPFYRKVDMDNLGIIGHSRGGEAAGIAGNFNKLQYYPDDATVKFDFNFNLKAIIAIAPSDQQYKPSGWPNPLTNVNYLTIQGAHDADVSVFSGARQYNRVKFTDGGDYFKAYIYSYRSNHGQFNTVWGDTDFGMPLQLLLNRRALLNGEEQRALGKTYFTAFLEAVLLNKKEYVPLFRDYRTGLDWLPEDYYINRYEDTTFQVICDFDEDVDVTTGTEDGVVIRGTGLPLWREEDLSFRTRGTKGNNVAVLGWRAATAIVEDMSETPGDEEFIVSDAPASYAVELPRDMAMEKGVDGSTKLVFSLCEADEELPEEENTETVPEEEKAEIPSGDDSGSLKNYQAQTDSDNMQKGTGQDEHQNGEADEESEEPLDLSVELEDGDGTAVRFSLSHFRSVPPMLRSRFMKLKKESFYYGSSYEPTLQLFELPLGEFESADPEFDPSTLRLIRLIFDRGREGVIFLDRLGFSR